MKDKKKEAEDVLDSIKESKMAIRDQSRKDEEQEKADQKIELGIKALLNHLKKDGREDIREREKTGDMEEELTKVVQDYKVLAKNGSVNF